MTRPHGDLQRMAVTPVAASFPWITTDRSGHFLLAASYDSNIVTSNRIDSQGSVTEQVTREVKTGPHAHSVITDVSNHALYVGNLGTVGCCSMPSVTMASSPRWERGAFRARKTAVRGIR